MCFPSTAGKLNVWWNVTEHINKSPLDWSLKSKATTLNLSRRYSSLISCFHSPSLFINLHSFLFLSSPTIYFIFFCHSLICHALILLWEAKKEMNKNGTDCLSRGKKAACSCTCRALHGRPTGSLEGGFLSHLSDVGQSGTSCPDGYINVERMLNITL